MDKKETLKPGIYRHFKGGMYELMFISRHSETEEEMVIYKSMKDGGYWARPIGMWNETVIHNGEEVLRFTPIS